MFFEPLPPPAPESAASPAVYYSSPGHEPEHWLPGLASLGIQLASTPTTSVFLAAWGSYPQGLALVLRAQVSPAEPVVEPPSRHDRRPLVGGLRLGMLWSDGRSVEAENHWGKPRGKEGTFRLTPGTGGGGGIHWLWNLWLWPLPPAEPVTVYCMWEERGIAETSTHVDLARVVAAAAEATELWPLPSPPPVPTEGGWFAFAPLDP
jgi:hypothetical protein